MRDYGFQAQDSIWKSHPAAIGPRQFSANKSDGSTLRHQWFRKPGYGFRLARGGGLENHLAVQKLDPAEGERAVCGHEAARSYQEKFAAGWILAGLSCCDFGWRRKLLNRNGKTRAQRASTGNGLPTELSRMAKRFYGQGVERRQVGDWLRFPDRIILLGRILLPKALQRPQWLD